MERWRLFAPPVRSSIPPVSGDEDDNCFYECADAAGAGYLITGNTEDFPSDHGPTKIITPRAFLDLIAPLLRRSE